MMSAPAMNRSTRPIRIGEPWLAGAALVLLALGLVMVASASLGIAEMNQGSAFAIVLKQAAYLTAGLGVAAVLMRVPLALWQKWANPLLAVGVCMLVLVFVPVIGREVNGSYRWLGLGFFNLQASELMKLFIVIYFAAYLARGGAHAAETLKGFAQALIPLAVVAVLVLAEPDLGATGVMTLTVLGLFFLAGVKLRHFLLLLAGVLVAMAALVLLSPYRFQRLISFMHACDPEFYHQQGYQLCQALIAFSRGEWLGVGLGSGVQKLFYLPEAHTDFLLAVLGEELGVLGSVAVVGLFLLLVWRIFAVARRCEGNGAAFSAFVCYGVGLWLGIQAFVNIAVNMGLLPTKGLTLPLMSYGGSSVMVTCGALALVLRADYECRRGDTPAASGRKKWKVAS